MDWFGIDFMIQESGKQTELTLTHCWPARSWHFFYAEFRINDWKSFIFTGFSRVKLHSLMRSLHQGHHCCTYSLRAPQKNAIQCGKNIKNRNLLLFALDWGSIHAASIEASLRRSLGKVHGMSSQTVPSTTTELQEKDSIAIQTKFGLRESSQAPLIRPCFCSSRNA